jgi:hypothetical protein
MLLLAGVTIGGLNSAVSLLMGILVLTLTVGSAVALVRASLVKATVEELRKDRDDQSLRIDRLEEENERLKRELQDEREARLALERVVTGADTLERIDAALREHNRKVEQFFKDFEAHDRKMEQQHHRTREFVRSLVDKVERPLPGLGGRDG